MISLVMCKCQRIVRYMVSRWHERSKESAMLMPASDAVELWDLFMSVSAMAGGRA